jgi:hypothetical protein
MSIRVTTEDLEWLQHRLVNRPDEDDETMALRERLQRALSSPEPRTLTLDEAEAGFVLVNLVGEDNLPFGLRELRDGIQEES